MATSSDDHSMPESIDVQELRRRILTEAPAPATDPLDMARVALDAMRTMQIGRIVPRATELRVRLAGDGVPGHEVSVHTAAQILDAMQGAVTAVASSMQRAKRVKSPKDASGKRLGVRKATELKLSPTISAGSVVFHLQGRAEAAPTEERLIEGGADSMVDVAVTELLRVLGDAQQDRADAIGELTSRLQHLGPAVASKLSALADHAVNQEIDLDLAHWSPSGARSAAVLKKRGAEAIREAVERNRQRVIPETLEGQLNTATDGTEKCRMTLPSGDVIRLAVEREVGTALGSLLGQRVVAEVETTVVWHIASGIEKRRHKLLSAVLADPDMSSGGPHFA